jgi:hypothetical protein
MMLLMANLRLVPRDLDAEALHWLNMAKRVLGGEITPEEAIQATRRHEADMPFQLGLHETSEIGWAEHSRSRRAAHVDRPRRRSDRVPDPSRFGHIHSRSDSLKTPGSISTTESREKQSYASSAAAAASREG